MTEITLRDFLAAMALNGILQNNHVQGALGEDVGRNAAAAYVMADAMLKAREPKPDGSN